MKNGKVTDLGRATPIAARGTSVAVARGPGAVELYDSRTGGSRTVAVGAANLAVTANLGAFSPDRRWLAAPDEDQPSPPGTMLIDVSNAPIVDKPMQFRELPGVVIGWGDDSSFVFVGYDGAVTAVNVRTMTPTPVPLPVGASPGIVTISPA